MHILLIEYNYIYTCFYMHLKYTHLLSFQK